MEAKDVHCLEPLVTSLAKRFDEIRFFDPFDDVVNRKDGDLRAFSEAELPAVVVSSVGTIETLNLIRPRETYLCIGIEHGIAPFKSYTYGRGLLSSDFYLAPTQGWAERLVRLYPEDRAKIRLGGYPKIEDIRNCVEVLCWNRENKSPGLIRFPRILVPLSWGIREDANEFLPDYSFIDYLLHPADHEKLDSLKFCEARVQLSRPDVTYPLIAEASLILGDFSSLTLECMSLGKRVSFLLDPSIYDGSCDLDASFAKRDSADFGRIPFTREGIDPAQTISAAHFRALASEFGSDISRWDIGRASISSEFLPPANVDNRELCAETIGDIVDLCRPLAARDIYADGSSIGGLGFLSDAYKALLSRPPDRSGLKYYLPIARGFEESDVANAISACREINRSPEAVERRAAPIINDSTDKILSVLGEIAEVDRRRALSTLDALSDHLLPSFHRARKSEAQTESERIRYGFKLLSHMETNSDDLVELAHECARGERLSDALHLIAKAIDLSPQDGELLRFKASVLERLGKFERALAVAEQAKLLKADAEAITFDILRLRETRSAELRRLSADSDGSGRLACYTSLVSIGAVETEDLIGLAEAYSSEGRLADALHWLSQAIELCPKNGELLRFRASILERLGRFVDALGDAERASALGADQIAIGLDIQRIQKRLVADTHVRRRSTDMAQRLRASADQLRIGGTGIADSLRLAVELAGIATRLLLVGALGAEFRKKPGRLWKRFRLAEPSFSHRGS